MKTANQTDSDCYGDDDVGVGDDGDFGVLMSLLMKSGVNSETLRLLGEPMPRLLGFGVLRALNDVRQVHITRPTRGRVLRHWDQ